MSPVQTRYRVFINFFFSFRPNHKTLKKFESDTVITQHNFVEISSSNNLQFKITNDNEIKLWSYVLIFNKNEPEAYFAFGKDGLIELIGKLEESLSELKGTE